MGTAPRGEAGPVRFGSPTRFDRFVGIDWSGARGSRHPSVQVAICAAGADAPRLVTPPAGVWSRGAVLDWLGAQTGNVLAGMDASFGLPAADPFLMPARDLWAEVERVAAADADLGAHGFVADPRWRPAFWLGAADGPRRDRALLRVTEQACRDQGLGAPVSSFVLLGANQVGKGALAAMRLLHRLGWPVWPFDPLPARGPVMVEIYCNLFARVAGLNGKLRDRTRLDAALAALGSAPVPAAFPDAFPDHVGDALITAAGLRALAGNGGFWSPQGLTPALRPTEGWTFGVA